MQSTKRTGDVKVEAIYKRTEPRSNKGKKTREKKTPKHPYAISFLPA